MRRSVLVLLVDGIRSIGAGGIAIVTAAHETTDGLPAATTAVIIIIIVVVVFHLRRQYKHIIIGMIHH